MSNLLVNSLNQRNVIKFYINVTEKNQDLINLFTVIKISLAKRENLFSDNDL